MRDWRRSYHQTDSGFIPNGQCVYDQLFIGLYGAFNEFVLCWQGIAGTWQYSGLQNRDTAGAGRGNWWCFRQTTVYCRQGSRFQPEYGGGVQARCLAIITIYTLAYTVNKAHIKTRQIQGPIPCVTIGVALGIMSSFLGIGGGPINLVVLYYFFSMSTKTAAQNSLYIILVSQITSIATTLFTKNVPEFECSGWF